MTAEAFKPSRANGMSDRMMILEHCREAEPGRLFTYDELTDVLLEGLDGQPVTRRRVQQAVGSANRTLLDDEQRYLAVVRNMGYRVADASQHLPLALAKKESAESAMQRGIAILRGTRMDELSENERKLHEGQMLVMSSLYQRSVAAEADTARLSRLVEDIGRRIDRLDGGNRASE